MIPEPAGPAEQPCEGQVYCAKHQVPLEMGRVELTYQGHTFPVDMLRCPVCGQALDPGESGQRQDTRGRADVGGEVSGAPSRDAPTLLLRRRTPLRREPPSPPAPPMTPLDGWIAGKIGAPGNRLDASALRAYQLDRLNQTLALVQQRSRFYRRLLGVRPLQLSSLERLQELPFTTSDQLKDGPYDFLCTRPDDVARIVTLPTSGTTGSPKRLFFTADDQELTRDFFHHGMSTLVDPGDRVGILLPGSIPGSVGTLLREGLARMDVEGIVLGPVRDPEETLRALAQARANSLVGIPVQVLELARLSRTFADLALEIGTVLLSTDYVPQAAVDAIEEIWGCSVFNHYGMTEMGLGGGVDCRALAGYHLREADLLFEIIDPESGVVVPEGERGEVVFTTLTRSAMPLVRYRTGDISRFVPGDCPCGTALRRMAHVDGRLGSGARVGKGLVSQKDLDECLLGLPGVVDFRATVDYGDQGTELHVAVKRCADSGRLDMAELEEVLRRTIPALATGAAPPVLLRIGPWDHDTVGGTGTSKRKIIQVESRQT